jgi:NADPH-dependent 2,4-dienoyl-CoA reductase/sulfur reductase-like enzyme
MASGTSPKHSAAGAGSARLPADDSGFILIDDYARVVGLVNVYAAGDAASFPIKQGGIATFPTYLRAAVGGGLADRGELAGNPLWWPPSKITGR